VWILGQSHRILALPRELLRWALRGDHCLIAVIDWSTRASDRRKLRSGV
jgi:hypothetical protein